MGKVYNRYFEGANVAQIVQWFDLGGSLKLDESLDSATMVQQLGGIQGLMEKTKALGLAANEPDAVRASAAEFVLEGLYAHRRISRNEERGFAAEEKKREPPREEGGGRPERPAPAAVQLTVSREATVRERWGEAVMKWVHYSRYTGEDMGIGAEDLLQALSDFLLESGFNNQYMPFSELNEHTLEDSEEGHPAGPSSRASSSTTEPPGDDGAPAEHDAGTDGLAARQPGAEDGRRGPDHHRGAQSADGPPARATARTAR